MNAIMRMALPVPAIGTAIGDEGDAYVASLAITVSVDGQPVGTLPGDVFEAIVTSMRVRHLAFHPRTRAFTAGSMKAPALVAAIDRNWSSIDGFAIEVDGLREAAQALRDAANGKSGVSWVQAN